MQIQTEHTKSFSLEELAILHYIKEQNNLILQANILVYLCSLKIFKGLESGALQYKMYGEIAKLVRKGLVSTIKNEGSFYCQMIISDEDYQKLMDKQDSNLKDSINNILRTALSDNATLQEMAKVIIECRESQQIEDDLKGKQIYASCIITILTSNPHITKGKLANLVTPEIQKLSSTAKNQIRRSCHRRITALIESGEIVITNDLLSLKTNEMQNQRQDEYQLKESATTILSALNNYKSPERAAKRTCLNFDKPNEDISIATPITYSGPARKNRLNNLEVLNISNNSARFNHSEDNPSQQTRDESIDIERSHNNSQNSTVKNATERMRISNFLNN